MNACQSLTEPCSVLCSADLSRLNGSHRLPVRRRKPARKRERRLRCQLEPHNVTSTDEVSSSALVPTFAESLFAIGPGMTQTSEESLYLMLLDKLIFLQRTLYADAFIYESCMLVFFAYASVCIFGPRNLART